MDQKKEFKDVDLMTKEDAIKEVKRFFKGNKKFIDMAVSIILSTHHFEKLDSLELMSNNWNWEKFMKITLDTKTGFKQFYYRKGNPKYAPGNVAPHLEGNKTFDIDGFRIVIYETKTSKAEEYEF